MSYDYDRRVANSQSLGPTQFAEDLQRMLELDGRQVRITSKGLGGFSTTFVNFINLPKGTSTGGGAEAENNRMAFSVEGFDAKDPEASPPSGKIKVEMRVSALPREFKLRSKTGTPAQIARYLADFINRVVKEVEPHYTHTRM